MQLSPSSKKITIGAVCLALIIYLFFESSNKGDFYIFLEASKSLLNGENIFQKTKLIFSIFIKPGRRIMIAEIIFCQL